MTIVTEERGLDNTWRSEAEIERKMEIRRERSDVTSFPFPANLWIKFYSHVVLPITREVRRVREELDMRGLEKASVVRRKKRRGSKA